MASEEEGESENGDTGGPLKEENREATDAIEEQTRTRGRDDGSTAGEQKTQVSDRGKEEPQVSVTIEGRYDVVLDRLDHGHRGRHDEVDAILQNIEETLLAVGKTGGGIRSEIYEAADIELEEPWEIRKYLEVLEMHDLVAFTDDEWRPGGRHGQDPNQESE